MNKYLQNRSRRSDPRQAEREARKAANAKAAFYRENELLFVSADGGKYYTPKPFKVPDGYPRAF